MQQSPARNREIKKGPPAYLSIKTKNIKEDQFSLRKQLVLFRALKIIETPFSAKQHVQA